MRHVDPHSLIKVWAHTLLFGMLNPNHWARWEIPDNYILVLVFLCPHTAGSESLIICYQEDLLAFIPNLQLGLILSAFSCIFFKVSVKCESVSHSVSDSLWPHRLQPVFQDPLSMGFSSKNTGVVAIPFPNQWSLIKANIGFVITVFSSSVVSLFDFIDCSLPVSSTHEIFQARILEWSAISSSRASPWPRNQTQVSCISCPGRWILFH